MKDPLRGPRAEVYGVMVEFSGAQLRPWSRRGSISRHCRGMLRYSRRPPPGGCSDGTASRGFRSSVAIHGERLFSAAGRFVVSADDFILVGTIGVQGFPRSCWAACGGSRGSLKGGALSGDGLKQVPWGRGLLVEALHSPSDLEQWMRPRALPVRADTAFIEVSQHYEGRSVGRGVD